MKKASCDHAESEESVRVSSIAPDFASFPVRENVILTDIAHTHYRDCILYLSLFPGYTHVHLHVHV